MKDLLVQSRFRNNILWSLMAGRSVSEICQDMGNRNFQCGFGALLNLKVSPFRKSGKGYSIDAQRIADYFRTLPEDLFPTALYELNLPNVVNREYESEHVSLLMARGMPSLLPSPQTVVEREELETAMNKVVKTLTPREGYIIKMRFGLQDGSEHTLEEVGNYFGVSRDRIRQIEGQVLRKLRCPRTTKLLEMFVKDTQPGVTVDELTREKEQEARETEKLYRDKHQGWASSVKTGW